MSILASEAIVYDQYSLQIRQEYGHLTSDQFKAGRSKFLESTLAHAKVFHTPDFDHLNTAALDNMRRELAGLQPSTAMQADL